MLLFPRGVYVAFARGGFCGGGIGGGSVIGVRERAV